MSIVAGTILRYLYSLFFYLAIPFILLKLYWRSRKAPDYRLRWAERFGWFKAKMLKQAIWIHAVSVGEFFAAIPIIETLQQRYPERDIIVTTMTPTGSAQVRKKFANSVFHVYVPYDLPDALNRFLNKLQPKLVVVMETELWPNLLHACQQRQIPVILANARLSVKSANGYARLPWIFKPMLSCLTLVAAQAQADADNFIKIGVSSEKVIVVGSVKFDIEIPEALQVQAIELRQQLGVERPVWIAASTHQGEDHKVLAAFKKIQQAIPSALLLLVPRHPERFKQVAALCEAQGQSVVLRSEQRMCNAMTNVFIGDSMGELLLFYAASDIAFVGGSLLPIGGHNLLEPIVLDKPVITGPYTHNFSSITKQLTTVGAAHEVKDGDELAAMVIKLLANDMVRQRSVIAGKTVIEQNRGSLAKQLTLIESFL